MQKHEHTVSTYIMTQVNVPKVWDCGFLIVFGIWNITLESRKYSYTVLPLLPRLHARDIFVKTLTVFDTYNSSACFLDNFKSRTRPFISPCVNRCGSQYEVLSPRDQLPQVPTPVLLLEVVVPVSPHCSELAPLLMPHSHTVLCVDLLTLYLGKEITFR